MNTRNEILAPASTFDTVAAAFKAGADAIYIGGELFGARAYADNPDKDNLNHIIDYAHILEKKVYLTVNTLLKNNELKEKLYNYLLPYYENGLDAVIVQDLGVFDFVRKVFPDLDVHCSTQMLITGVDSAKMFKEMGATRIVTARELSLNEIKEIHDNIDIEIESFIHGAMCYSYSGMCLFSSMIGGRSGNRGRCAGPCRQPYEVFKNQENWKNSRKIRNSNIEYSRLNDKSSLYALSLKDMNTLEILPEIIESGVYSLKIEGRMKSAEYCAGVVSTYRKYLDKYYEFGKEKYKIDKKDYKNLYDLYSRSGSLTGYYKCHNDKNMISVSKPAYKTGNEEYVEYLNNKYCKEPLKKNLTAKLLIKTGCPLEIEVSDCVSSKKVIGEVVEAAQKRAVTKEDIFKQINKTGDSFVKFENIFIDIEGDNFIPVSKLNDIRREAIDKYISDNILNAYRRTAEKEIEVNNLFDKNIEYKNDQLSNSKMISVQISSLEQLEKIINAEEVKDKLDYFYIATDQMKIEEVVYAVKKMKSVNKEFAIILPYIFRNNAKNYLKNLLEQLYLELNLKKEDILFMVRNVDELGYVKELKLNFMVDSTLYAFNNNSKSFFYGLGAKRVTMPHELNYKELKAIVDCEDEVCIYGYIPLMISAGCVNKYFDKCDYYSKNIRIRDRLGADFDVANCCNFCYNIVYNNLPLSLLGNSKKVNMLNNKWLRINLTKESGKQAKFIIEKCIDVYVKGEDFEFDKYTRGHFNRGVE